MSKSSRLSSLYLDWFKVISPLSALIRPAIKFINVVFPDPELPKTIKPSLLLNDISGKHI